MAKQLANCFAFRRVVEESRRSMRINVIDCICRNLRALEGSLHRPQRSNAAGIRLSKMKIVGGHAVARYFCENGHTACARGVQIFQYKNRCAFTEDHAGAMPVKWAALFWRR